MASRNRIPFFASIAAFGFFSTTTVLGQAGGQPSQTLDQVDAFNSQVVLDMAFDDPNAPADYADRGIDGSNLAACKLGAQGLYCLETNGLGQQVVRRWKDPQKPLEFVDLLRCDDLSLGLAGTRPCSGLTFDLSGAVWVSGIKANAAYSLVKVVAKASLAGCPGNGDWTVLTSNATLCAREFATGNGVLADLDAIDGEVGAAFDSLGTGILAIQNGNAVSFFNLNVPGAPPTSFGSWSLASGTRLLSTALLQVPAANPVDPVSNFLVATTNKGKILSKPTASPATVSQVFDMAAWEQARNPAAAPITIDATTWGPCLTPALQTSCTVSGATLTANGGTGFILKSANGASGLGVAGGASGNEIDIGQSILVTFPAPQSVAAIQVLFLYNGPEFNDKAEVAQVITDQGTYTLSLRNNADDAAADWSGPGTVTKCGATTSTGPGCFLITNPFPSPVASLRFAPLAGSAPFAGTGTDNSDFAIGLIDTANYGLRTSFKTGRAYVSSRGLGAVLALQPNSSTFTALQPVKINSGVDDLALSTLPTQPDGLTVAPGITIDLADCTENCAWLKDANGNVTASFDNVRLAPGPSGTKIFQVKNLPDCRYVPQVCRTLLMGSNAASDDAARQDLINAGWILPLDTANKLKPAAELLNVTPLLPEDVTGEFDASGIAPNGLPPLYISNQYRGQSINQYRFQGFFFKTAVGIVFLDTFEAEFDVAKLAGQELGCVPVPGRLRELDVSTSVSETYKSVGGRYIDTITNIGCGTTRIVNKRLSFGPYNLEVAPDTYRGGVVTVNNDGLFARLVQSLGDDLEAIRRDFACTQADPVPSGGIAPLSKTTCSNLAQQWSGSKLTGGIKQKLDKCVDAAFQPKASASNENCNAFRTQLAQYQSSLPASATGPDPANRLGELKARVATLSHIFETRFLPSIPPTGFCREKNRCPP